MRPGSLSCTTVYPVITGTPSDKLHVESNSVVQAQDSDNVYLWICSKGILASGPAVFLRFSKDVTIQLVSSVLKASI